MHSFNNPLAENKRKTWIYRVYLRAYVRYNLNTITIATIKHFLQQCIVLTILLLRITEKHFNGEFITTLLKEIFLTLKEVQQLSIFISMHSLKKTFCQETQKNIVKASVF